MTQLSSVELTLLVGAYAQKWHLKERAGKSLTSRVQAWEELTSEGLFTTPHPSWRNTGWLKRNPFFEEDLLPVLRKRIRELL